MTTVIYEQYIMLNSCMMALLTSHLYPRELADLSKLIS